MKILHLSRDDNTGGASRAAYRLHCALLENDSDSAMRVLNHETANVKVKTGRAHRSFKAKVQNKLIQLLRTYSNRNFKTDNLILHTFGDVSAGIVEELNNCDADILNIHWIAKFLSIEDLGRLCKPLVWTFHDMWALCGGEHVAPDDEQSRFRIGYLPDNRPKGESGPDLNRFAWERKKKAWKTQRFNVVAPSQWMARCVRESVLFKNSPVHVIPNPLEMNFTWRPIDKVFARRTLGLNPNKKYIVSGSAGGMPHLKGEDLFYETIKKIANTDIASDTELLIFGQYQPISSLSWPLPVNWLGPIKDDNVMAAVYSAADVTVVPSRQDNLPNIAVESHACGTPVAGFNIGGIPDIVNHLHTGWIADSFNTDDLANGIYWMLSDSTLINQLSREARASAISKYDTAIVANQYLNLYSTVLRNRR